ncbi:MAG: glutamate--tRNA ligase [Deltaproteobacteria bacterium CG_4_9_14_3_um_filter_63_12]|nr:MAG: glutamate--tRNA ligase [Deltaproteobacteria bacterium CG_4_9_14_3_um_filter_63_12]
MHMGNARTALFNWLYARHVGGTFLLRIEDTDRERSTKEAVQVIYDSLKWMGLDWDEDVIFQSDRLDVYRDVANRLIDAGFAYRCTCTREELEAIKVRMEAETGQKRYDRTCRDKKQGPDCGEHVIRFATPITGESAFEDLIQGSILKQQEELDDFIMMRTDGTPTYQFAVVVDDEKMRITHVIRGVDHIDNTHDQLNLYRALGFTPPQFAHAPRILGLSKRKGSPSVEYYRQAMGLTREGLLNYIVRLGWSHGDQEIFSMEELIAAFDLKDVNRASGNFDDVKLAWVNEQQLRKIPLELLADYVLPYFQEKGLNPEKGPWFYRMLDVIRLRATHLGDFVDRCDYFFNDIKEYEEKAAKKHLKSAMTPVLLELADRFEKLGEWTEEAIAAVMTRLCEEKDTKLGKIAQPARVALSGCAMTPGIYETIWLIGRERTVSRLKAATQWIAENDQT